MLKQLFVVFSLLDNLRQQDGKYLKSTVRYDGHDVGVVMHMRRLCTPHSEVKRVGKTFMIKKRVKLKSRTNLYVSFKLYVGLQNDICARKSCHYTAKSNHWFGFSWNNPRTIHK